MQGLILIIKVNQREKLSKRATGIKNQRVALEKVNDTLWFQYLLEICIQLTQRVQTI